MANEAVCIEAPKMIVNRKVTGAIAKGTVLKMSASPNTVAASSADNDVFAGIALEEVTAADYAAGVDHVAAAIDGVFGILTAGAITLGAVVNISGANTVNTSAAADLLTGSVVGVMEETGDGSLNRVRLRGY